MDKLLDKSLIRYTLFPIQHYNLWNEFKKQQNSIWSAEEIDFSNDYNDFMTLSFDEQHVIKMILAFFASMDGIVNFNIEENLIRHIVSIEALTCYRFQVMMEGIHNECYSMMIDNLIKDNNEKEYLFNSIETIPTIKKISDWSLKFIESDEYIGLKIIAFAFIEGVLFSGAFACIYWLKHVKGQGKLFLNGLIKSNEFISRDESLHVNFACELYKMLDKKVSNIEVENLIKEAVDMTKSFNNETIKTKLIGLNNDSMNQYTEYVCDRLLVQLGYNKLFNSSNPFSFMNTIGMIQKTNFHETRPSEYKKSTNSSINFTLESDF